MLPNATFEPPFVRPAEISVSRLRRSRSSCVAAIIQGEGRGVTAWRATGGTRGSAAVLQRRVRMRRTGRGGRRRREPAHAWWPGTQRTQVRRAPARPVVHAASARAHPCGAEAGVGPPRRASRSWRARCARRVEGSRRATSRTFVPLRRRGSITRQNQVLLDRLADPESRVYRSIMHRRGGRAPRSS